MIWVEKIFASTNKAKLKVDLILAKPNNSFLLFAQQRQKLLSTFLKHSFLVGITREVKATWHTKQRTERKSQFLWINPIFSPKRCTYNCIVPQGIWGAEINTIIQIIPITTKWLIYSVLVCSYCTKIFSAMK